MSNIDDQIEILTSFNEKVKELLELSFVKESLLPNVGVNLKGKRRDDGKFDIETASVGPSDEAIKAFVLTFRFFIQDNEKTSLSNIAALYNTSNFDPVLINKFNLVRFEMNKMLDSNNILEISIDGDIPSNRKIMEVFVYGGLAHNEPSKNRLYKTWKSFPPVFAILQYRFTMILIDILTGLGDISKINEKTIELLKQQRTVNNI